MLFGKSPSRLSNDEKRARIDAMYGKVRASIPDVPEMTAREVMDRREAGERIVLVDARTEAEQGISMIPGAVPADALDVEAAQRDGATVVCYCTIGGRSGRCAQTLRERGLDAANMPGAILAWSHEGGELADANGPTKRVHTHGPKFDLLAEGYEAVW